MTEKRNITGAEALLLSLLEEGVTDLFGYPGGAIIPLYDKLYDYTDRLNHILTRHEQGAVHAAQGYARATGRVGVCMATSGPGATNLITGIADAMVDSTPLVCITAQVAASLLGTDAFQEADIISMTIPVTKWNHQVTSAAELPETIAKAFYIARTGRPGPVVIDITKNAQTEILDSFVYTPCTGLRSYLPEPEVRDEAVARAVELIDASRRPLMITGQGVMLSGGEAEAARLAERCAIPVATTLMGLSAVPTSHPLFVGRVGMHGNVAANEMTQQADLLIAVGMRFSDRVTGDVSHYAPDARIIHIDIDAAEHGKIVKPDVSICGDARKALSALADKAAPRTERREWMETAREAYERERRYVIEGCISPAEGDITMGEAVDKVASVCGGEAIIVTDVGQHQMFASRYSRLNRPRSFITSGGLGTMGFGLPAAIGAKVGCPDREVVLFVGDGGLQMTVQELGTVMQSGIAVKIAVLDNGYLGMVRQWQQLFFESRYSFTSLADPDFTILASAYGIASRRVSARDSLEEAVREMLAHDGPYLLDIAVEREGNVFPMVPAGKSISNLIFSELNDGQ